MHKDYPRRIVLLTGILVLAEFRLYPLSAAEEKTPRLRVSHAGHFLETASGDPFFYLADTAWELFHRLDKTETTLYLDTRARQGFNVIQAVALAEFDGITEPNAEGNLPLLENDPAKPNEQYFKHVDWVIEQAANRGMFVGVLPTWGDKVRKDWGVGPVIFNARNARVYGNFPARAIGTIQISSGFWAAIVRQPARKMCGAKWLPDFVRETAGPISSPIIRKADCPHHGSGPTSRGSVFTCFNQVTERGTCRTTRWLPPIMPTCRRSLLWMASLATKTIR